ncbi:ORF018R [Rock bream iridovirus]|uniref:ORF018R n=1 Tax=Rock bream iridovirus TaxID=263891 RepID=Q5YF69_ISKNV|nr:ORF018R [Rock bream iridovirus]
MGLYGCLLQIIAVVLIVCNTHGPVRLLVAISISIMLYDMYMQRYTNNQSLHAVERHRQVTLHRDHLKLLRDVRLGHVRI